MPNEEGAGPAATPYELDVAPVVVLSRSFPARPASLPEAQSFLNSTLADVRVEPEYLQALQTAILDAMLLAAGPGNGMFEVVIHTYPDGAQVEVLASADRDAELVWPASDEPFAAWLTQALRREGLSQEAAARQLGVSVRTVSRWVRGQTEPRLRDMRRIQEVFGRTPIS
jgi:DNA-binding XRE family transcriptional regulator